MNGDQQQGNREDNHKTKDDMGQSEVAKFRKLELPLFAGEDPLGWIFKVERYFTVNGITEGEKMDVVAVSLKGKALTWFQWLEARTSMKSWKECKQEIVDRFHCLQQGDEYEQLMGLRQETIVEEFRERFELLLASLGDVQEEVLMGAFKNGLKEEIQAEMRLMHPCSLKQLMNFALQIEDKNSVIQRVQEEKRSKVPKTIGPSGSGRWPKFKPPIQKFSFLEPPKSVPFSSITKHLGTTISEESKSVSSKVSHSVATPSSSSSSVGPRRRLSDAEINRRRAFGLCFKCEEKFGPNQICKNK